MTSGTPRGTLIGGPAEQPTGTVGTGPSSLAGTSSGTVRNTTRAETEQHTPLEGVRVPPAAPSVGRQRREWRVRWTRPMWAPDRPPSSRCLQRLHDAQRLAERLTASGATDIQIQQRAVGEWRPVQHRPPPKETP